MLLSERCLQNQPSIKQPILTCMDLTKQLFLGRLIPSKRFASNQVVGQKVLSYTTHLFFTDRGRVAEIPTRPPFNIHNTRACRMRKGCNYWSVPVQEKWSPINGLLKAYALLAHLLIAGVNGLEIVSLDLPRKSGSVKPSISRSASPTGQFNVIYNSS